MACLHLLSERAAIAVGIEDANNPRNTRLDGPAPRVAGGREITLRALQVMALYPANSIFVNGYLTTPGQEASDAHQMISDLGFELDSPAAI